MKWYVVAQKDAIPVNEGKRVRHAGYEVALFNHGGEFSAVDNACPHKQGPLADGIVSGKKVTCPLHNLSLSLETGCALKGGEGQVKVYPTKVDGDVVCIAFEEGKCST